MNPVHKCSGNVVIDDKLSLYEQNQNRADGFSGPGGNIEIQMDGWFY